MKCVSDILCDLTSDQISGKLSQSDIAKYIPIIKEYFDDVIDLSNESASALIGYKKGKADGAIVFVCHLDVVPGNKEIMQPKREGNIIYARGAVDMKGAIASAIHAIQQMDCKMDCKMDCYSILMCLHGDEETDGLAALITSSYIQEHFAVKFIIGTEPTSISNVSDNIKTARMASITCSVHNYSPTQHVAYADYNPANVLCNQFSLLSQKFSICNIIDFNTQYIASNCTPEHASIAFNIRSAKSYEELMKDIENIFQDITVNSFRNGFISMINKNMLCKIQDSIAKITGNNVNNINSGGTSDLYAFAHIAPYIELGLLNKHAHSDNEHVSIDDMNILSSVYLKIIEIINNHQ